MTILTAAQTRHATKAFDKSKTIPADTVEALKELLQTSPSSVNAQPWHFVIASSPEAKERIAKTTPDYNQPKITDASHVIVFCNKTSIDDDYIDHINDQEDSDGRFRHAEDKQGALDVKQHYIGLHRDTLDDIPAWTAKQTYLNIGWFLLGAASLGLDTVPMEGFDAQALDAELGLSDKDLTSTVIVSVGYKGDDDFNADLPKSRLPLSELLTEI